MVRKRVAPRELRVNPRSSDKRPSIERVRDNLRMLAEFIGTADGGLTTLSGYAALATLLDDMTLEAVSEARVDGYSWSEIGAALGMSKQAAQQRYITTTATEGDEPS